MNACKTSKMMVIKRHSTLLELLLITWKDTMNQGQYICVPFFSAFLRDFSLWLDWLSGDGSLRHLAQPCCVALGRALICMAVSRVVHLMHLLVIYRCNIGNWMISKLLISQYSFLVPRVLNKGLFNLCAISWSNKHKKVTEIMNGFPEYKNK